MSTRKVIITIVFAGAVSVVGFVIATRQSSGASTAQTTSLVASPSMTQTSTTQAASQTSTDTSSTTSSYQSPISSVS